MENKSFVVSLSETSTRNAKRKRETVCNGVPKKEFVDYIYMTPLFACFLGFLKELSIGRQETTYILKPFFDKKIDFHFILSLEVIEN